MYSEILPKENTFPTRNETTVLLVGHVTYGVISLPNNPIRTVPPRVALFLPGCLFATVLLT